MTLKTLDKRIADNAYVSILESFVSLKILINKRIKPATANAIDEKVNSLFDVFLSIFFLLKINTKAAPNNTIAPIKYKAPKSVLPSNNQHTETHKSTIPENIYNISIVLQSILIAFKSSEFFNNSLF